MLQNVFQERRSRHWRQALRAIGNNRIQPGAEASGKNHRLHRVSPINEQVQFGAGDSEIL
jgi:hypothetical protein